MGAICGSERGLYFTAAKGKIQREGTNIIVDAKYANGYFEHVETIIGKIHDNVKLYIDKFEPIEQENVSIYEQESHLRKRANNLVYKVNIFKFENQKKDLNGDIGNKEDNLKLRLLNKRGIYLETKETIPIPNTEKYCSRCYRARTTNQLQ